MAEKIVNNTDKVFTTNKYGIPVVKCCASCKFKEFDKGGMRVCTNGFGGVKTSFLCTGWQMRESLDNAGKADGRVKKKDYLLYVVRRRSEEIERLMHNIYTTPAKVDDIRREYKHSFGSIYVDGK